MDSTGYVRRSENPGKKQCRIDGQDPSECRATPRIFPDPVPFRNGYGCVGLQDKGSISVVHVMLMTFFCVAPEVRLLKRK